MQEPNNQSPAKRHRSIKSYVLREGRLTPGQERAFTELWPKWGVNFVPESGSEPHIDPARLFPDSNPVFLEIGFGNGESLLEYAVNNPNKNFIGIEVHSPGVGHLLIRIEELGLSNIRVIRHDAVEVLKAIKDHSLAGAMLFFPDPWHKKKHHKRRILQAGFVNELARIIRPGGVFHAATDWENYAEHMMNVLSASADFENTSEDGLFSQRPDTRPLTKFEQRGRRLGHGVWDLLYRRKEPPA